MSQTQRLLNYLSHPGRSVTSMQCFKMFGITSLHRRLHDMKKLGHPSRGEWVERNGKHFKKYFLV